jgi:hypothetical protein
MKQTIALLHHSRRDDHGSARYLRRTPSPDNSRWDALYLRTPGRDDITIRVVRAAPGRITLELDLPDGSVLHTIVED